MARIHDFVNSLFRFESPFKKSMCKIWELLLSKMYTWLIVTKFAAKWYEYKLEISYKQMNDQIHKKKLGLTFTRGFFSISSGLAEQKREQMHKFITNVIYTLFISWFQFDFV